MLQIYKACQLFLNKNGNKLEQKKKKERKTRALGFFSPGHIIYRLQTNV